MKKKIFNFLLNIAVFWIVADTIPGFKAPYGAVSRLYAGLAFALVMVFTGWVRSVFGLPKMMLVRLILGTILTFAMLWFVSNFGGNFFSFGQSSVGGANFILFSIPKIMVLQDINLVLLLAALIGNFCSIIVFKLKTR